MTDKLQLYKDTVFNHVKEYHPDKEFIYRYQRNTDRHIIYASDHFPYHTRMCCYGDDYHFFVNPWLNGFRVLENELELLGFIRDLYP